VGCGQGPALDWFSERGFNCIGTSLCDEDIEICRAKGRDVIRADMHSLDASPGKFFHLVWARHVLEHSVAPMLALSEFHRVLKPGGWLYAEMPMPDTACRHCTNVNHYSVLTGEMWANLIDRSGFDLKYGDLIDLKTAAGPDQYHWYLAQKL
jgi:SAM-dependent methyltransferase